MPPNVIAFVKSEVGLESCIPVPCRYLYLNVMLLMIQNVNCQCSGGGHLEFMPELSF